jgi:hypothetical protein
MASQFHNLAVKLTDLLPDGIARFEQRSDRSYQLRTTLDQLLGSHGEDIELGTADDETKVLEKAANMVLEIVLGSPQIHLALSGPRFCQLLRLRVSF